MAIKQRELEGLVLLALYEHFQRESDRLSLPEITSLLAIDITDARVDMALGVLIGSGFVMRSQVVVAGQVSKYWLTDEGYKYAEELADRVSQEVDSNPLSSFENRLTPAADRFVSFGDNQDDRGQAIENIDRALEIVRSSNQLDENLRDEVLVNVEAGKNVIETSKRFLVGVFKFLIWDRLKAVVETVIEEAYKVALMAILMTLGALIIGLL